jgi:hypothetical protein
VVLSAAVIHAWIAPHHAAETALFGVAAGLAEGRAAALLLVQPIRLVLGGTFLGAPAPVGIFVVAHAVGRPFGPRSGEPAELEPLGIASKATEGLPLPLLAYLDHVLRPRAPRRRPRPEASSLVS